MAVYAAIPPHPHIHTSTHVQSYLARPRIESFSLTADMMYISQNCPRIMRAIFEICMRRTKVWARGV